MKFQDTGIQVPISLKSILDDYKEESSESAKNYINSISRKVDVLFLCAFFGMYQARTLPPDIDPESYETSIANQTRRERFSVNVISNIDLFRHNLFLLWVCTESTSLDNPDYRRKFYHFLEQILNPDYFVKVVLPFYLQEADKNIDDEPSFITKLKNSGKVGYSEDIFAPEFLVLEFLDVKNSFVNHINNKLAVWKKTYGE